MANYTKDLYRAEVSAITRLTPEQREQLIQQARVGDQRAKERLIIACLPPIYAHAHRYVRIYDDDSLLELTCIGNTTLVASFDRLIQRDLPIARLLSSAYGEMRHYWTHLRGPIALPCGPVLHDYIYTSLERMVREERDPEAPTDDRTAINLDPLYQAIDSLPPGPRQNIIRSFGLFGQTAETISELASGATSSSKEYNAAKAKRLYALNLLRQRLGTTYAAHLSLPTKKKRIMPNIVLPEWCKQRLDDAAQVIQARGEQLSMNKLRKEARVHTRYASLYLYQKRGA